MPRLARDEEWAATLVEAWRASGATSDRHEERSLRYGDGLYGVLVEPKEPKGGVVLFHTAAGPRDLFLHWKAHQLADLGFVCLIADLYGDQDGRGWSDPAWAASQRDRLRDRAVAAVDALQKEKATPSHVGALGYCLGGRAAIEALKGKAPGLRAVVSFHGVLDDSPVDDDAALAFEDASILVLHGRDDPFASEGLSRFEEQMRDLDALCDVVILAKAKHGFTNPAQALNDKPGFDFSQRAADLAWQLAVARLQETLLSPEEEKPSS